MGHHITRVNPGLFLDKACINQSSAELKAEGIRNLGAFLKNSDSMLVFWSRDYFDRLWCVYELSLFIKLKGTRDLVIMPLKHAALGLVLSAVCVVYGAFRMALDSYAVAESGRRPSGAAS